MKQRILALGLLVGLLGSATAAAEPIRLTDQALDQATAAAAAGIEILARSRSGQAEAEAIASLVNTRGWLDAEAVAVTPNGAAFSRIGGPVFFAGNRSASFALGLVAGQTEASGDGEAAIGASGAAQGDLTVAADYVFAGPRGVQVGLAFGLGIDLPRLEPR